MSGFPPTQLNSVLEELGPLLSSSNKKIAIAETTTGGLISAALLTLPGASKWYAGGATLYTMGSRYAWGGLTDDGVAQYTGPTPEVVTRLATHVLGSLKADICLSESGTAGPTAAGGKYVNSIVGNVSLAAVSRIGKVRAFTVSTGHNKRDENMVAFAKAALEFLRDFLEEELHPSTVNAIAEGTAKM